MKKQRRTRLKRLLAGMKLALRSALKPLASAFLGIAVFVGGVCCVSRQVASDSALFSDHGLQEPPPFLNGQTVRACNANFENGIVCCVYMDTGKQNCSILCDLASTPDATLQSVDCNTGEATEEPRPLKF